MAFLRHLLVVSLCLSVAGCAFVDDFDDFTVERDAGGSDSGGAGGSGGSSGVGGTSGGGGSSGVGGASGSGGTGGSGVDSGFDAGQDSGMDAAFDGAVDAASDSGTDAGTDAATDAGTDAGTDAAADAGTDAAADAGTDAGTDAATDLCASVVCPLSDCQVGVCNPASGVCQYVAVNDGDSCTDNQACTDDECVSGICVSTAVDCSGLDAACVVGVCNSSTGACQTQNRTNSTPCEDGSLCTLNDTCQSGTCTAGAPRDCSGSNSGQCIVGVCNSANGMCQAQNRNNNTPCDDGSMCTLNDTCQSGGCTAGTPRDCSGSDSGQCIVGVCNPASGICQAQNRTNNTPCSDGAGCTTGDACSAGVCVSGTFVCMQACNQTECDVNHCSMPDANACALSSQHNGSCDCGCQYGDGIDCGTSSVCDFFGTTSGAPCPLSWKGDGACDCTCDFSGSADSIDCATSPACVNNRTLTYPTGNCPNSMDGNGVCDCGCQFGSGVNVRDDSDCPN